jgi:hypothetical protein
MHVNPDASGGDARPGDEAPKDARGVGENVCPDCGGSGRQDSGECATCSGTGRVAEGVGGG